MAAFRACRSESPWLNRAIPRGGGGKAGWSDGPKVSTAETSRDCEMVSTMKRLIFLSLAVVALALAGCETASSDNSPQPQPGKGHGMSPGAEAHTSTGVR